MSLSPSARGPGRAGLTTLAEALSQRDRRVLREVQRHRFLRTDHIQRLVFTTHRSSDTAARVCRSVLGRLRRQGLLHALPRRVGGLPGGAAHTVWQLTTLGQRLLNLLNGDGSVSRFAEVGQLFVQHYLAIADTHLTLLEAHAAQKLELLSAALEPDCWRSYIDGSGVTQVVKPDLAIVTAYEDYEDHWFIEVDRGTESMPTLLRQCQAYARYRATGIEQDRTGVFPRIIWLLPTARRRDLLLDAIGNARQLERGLFYALLTPDQLIDFIPGGTA